jgi:hypothetical protein
MVKRIETANWGEEISRLGIFVSQLVELSTAA